MASKEISREFRLDAGQVVVTIEDDHGSRTVHTINVIDPDGAEVDVANTVADLLSNADARTAKIGSAFQKCGWKPAPIGVPVPPAGKPKS
jgi:hypothetical protein